MYILLSLHKCCFCKQTQVPVQSNRGIYAKKQKNRNLKRFRPLFILHLQNYSALGASSVVASAAGASAAAADADFLERRVRVAFLAAVLAMFSL